MTVPTEPVVVQLSGSRMEGEVCVRFSDSGTTGLRRLFFGNDRFSAGSTIRINGVEIDVAAVAVEEQPDRTWRVTSSRHDMRRVVAGSQRWGEVSDSARKKIRDWAIATAPAIAEENMDRFVAARYASHQGVATLARESAQRFDRMAKHQRERAELADLVAGGDAEVVLCVRQERRFQNLSTRHGEQALGSVTGTQIANIVLGSEIVGLIVASGQSGSHTASRAVPMEHVHID